MFKNTVSILAAAVLCTVVSASAIAAEYTLKTAPQSLADWKDGSFYVGGVAPTDANASSATNILPANMTAKVDDDSIAFVSSLAWIKPQHRTSSILEVDVSTNALLGCAFYYADRANSTDIDTRGKIVKKGNGVLSLADKSSVYAYLTDILIRQGAVVLVPRNDQTSHYYGRIEVDEGAMLIPGHDESQPVYNWMISLGGAGVVSNGVGRAANCVILPGYGEGYPVEFSGRILDKIYLYQHGWQYYTGTNSTYSGGTRMQANSDTLTRGIIGIKKLGMKGEPSSIGTGSIDLQEHGGRMLYLGTGETSDKDIGLYEKDGKLRQEVIDAGANGGLTLIGAIKPGTSSSLNQRLWLTGSNTTECVIAGSLDVSSGSRAYISKKGSGTWRLGAVARTGISGIAVEEGTLRFDSLFEKGTACSVGDGAIYTIDKWYGPGDTPEEVPYQFKLGTATTAGVLEFTGTNEAYAAMRPLVLAGEGTLKNSGTNFAFASTISPLGDTERTLTLDGDVDTESSVSDLSDGEGLLSVVKKGEGTWFIDSTNVAFTGAIDVQKGKLVLRGYGGFTWYRWTIRALQGENPDCTLGAVAELAFFDSDDMRPYATLPQATVSWGDVHLDPGQYRGVIRPGTSGLGRKFSYVRNILDIGRMFDGKAGRDNYFEIVCQTNTASGRALLYPTEDDPSTYLSFVVRMPKDAKPVKSYDWACWGTGSSRHPKSFLMEASVDGMNWMVVDDVHNGPWPKGSAYSFKWAYNGAGTAGAEGTKWGIEGDPHPNGRILASWTNAPLTIYSQPVSVARDAVLEAQGPVQLSAIAVDPDNAGTIKDFKLAANGTLLLTKKVLEATVLPLSFEGVSAEDVLKIANWTLEVQNGVTHARINITGDGEIKIVPVGFCVSFR